MTKNYNYRQSLPKSKTRKYDEMHVALGFTVTAMGDEERPVSLQRLKMLANTNYAIYSIVAAESWGARHIFFFLGWGITENN